MITRSVPQQGVLANGRIAKLLSGQGYGVIRVPNHREVFFHRADLRDGTAFRDLCVGDSVLFELFEDRISGPRALQVRRSTRSR